MNSQQVELGFVAVLARNGEISALRRGSCFKVATNGPNSRGMFRAIALAQPPLRVFQ